MTPRIGAQRDVLSETQVNGVLRCT